MCHGSGLNDVDVKDGLLITESPKTPGHCSYLIWVHCYIPYAGLNGVQFCDCSCSCVYCDSEFVNFVFSTLRSRNCFQLFPFYLGGVNAHCY